MPLLAGLFGAFGAQVGLSFFQYQQQKDALEEQRRERARQLAEADRQFNKANPKRPNVKSLFDNNVLAGLAGYRGTDLTGGAFGKPTLSTSTVLGA